MNTISGIPSPAGDHNDRDGTDKGPASSARPRADGFLDRSNNRITITEWERRRRDPDYCIVAHWQGEGAASVCTFWLGVSTDSEDDARYNFATHVCAFEKCPQPDYFYRWGTEDHALERHDDIVWLVERGIKPWDDDAVLAAGLDPFP